MLSEQQRSELLDKISETVTKRFYGLDLKWIDWPSAVARHRDEIVSATLDETFEQAVFRLLAELKRSHVGFFHTGLSRASSKMALCATYAPFPLAGEERWVFQDVHEGGPAALAGIRPGDILISVEGRNFSPPEHPTFPIGSTVTVNVLTRGLSEAARSVSIPSVKQKANQLPQVLPQPVVSHRRINHETGYLKIAAYPGEIGVDVANEMSRSVEKLKPCARLIMDLRGNSGGGVAFLRALSLLTPDRSPIGRFSSGKLVRTTVLEENSFVFGRIPASKLELYLLVLKFGGTWLTKKAMGRPNPVTLVTEGCGAQPFHGRVVLLVDRHTASANEMLIAAAREWKLATTVGEPTPGRVLGGAKFKLPYGYWLALPVGAYQTATGDEIEGQPIPPDVLVEFDHEQARAGVDTQLEKAIEVVSEL
jgi:C-terminal processing protease CtpA/Prc